MLNVLRFWLELGVDGFRGDVISLIIKDASFRDDTLNPDWTPSQPIIGSTLHDRSQHQPESHELIRKMRAALDEYGDRVLIGEIYLPYKRLMSYYGDRLDECHLPLNFGLLTCPFQAESIIALVNEYESLLPKGAWPNWVLGNHDKDRIASENRAGEANARLAQMLLLTLRGTPTMYYGDELGMPNGDIPPEKFQDPAALNEPGVGRSRDLARTPMQWDETPYGGFSQGDPWLPLSRDFGSRNVTSQEATPRSFLQMVKQLIAIRRSSPALHHGRYSSVAVGIPDVMAYLRIQGDVKILVVLNFSDEEKLVDLSSTAGNGKVMLSTTMDRNGDVSLQTLKLRQHEGLMIQLI
jgi:alpha-glucosidase